MDNQSSINNKNNNNCTINNNVTQIVDNAGYKKDKQLFETTKKYFAKLMPSDEDYLSTSQTINELKSSIELYETTLQDTAKILEQAKDDKDLDSVRRFIKEGNIEEARVWFADNKETLFEDEQRLDAKRQAISNKFLIWASLSQTNYDNLNWFEDTCDYFKRSINASANKYNAFECAKFLQENENLTLAEQLYQKSLTEFASDILPIERATFLNNLAVLHKAQNKYEEALAEYEEALKIRRQLAEVNPNTYLPDVAMTLNNLAVLHSDQNKYEEALAEYEEALKIRRQLAEVNPNTYLPDVAMTLNNLAILHSDQNKYEEALAEYEEALKIRRQLAEVNPNTYLPDVATTAINLSIFYLQAVSNREKSVGYAVEAVKILLPIFENVPFTQSYMQTAMAVLKAWNLSEEEIQQLITDSENQKT
jgi:tetratricopeptide (TPR) repeat protein